MKQRKNSCCLSGSEFTSFGLNLVTVLSRRCFSFLSNILSFFFAIKKKEYLVRGLGLHKPQYKTTSIDKIYVIQSRQAKNLTQTRTVIQSRLLRLALNGYTQIQIEKILFPIMNFRFSPSARLAEESQTNLTPTKKTKIYIYI